MEEHRHTPLYCVSQMFCFYELEASPHQQRDGHVLYRDTRFTAVAWDQACRSSEVCLARETCSQAGTRLWRQCGSLGH